MSHDDPMAYLHTITTEEVMTLVPSHAAGRDAVRLAYQNEVMMTSTDGRYSGKAENMNFFFLAHSCSTNLILFFL
jgi:hypothetical protein